MRFTVSSVAYSSGSYYIVKTSTGATVAGNFPFATPASVVDRTYTAETEYKGGKYVIRANGVAVEDQQALTVSFLRSASTDPGLDADAAIRAFLRDFGVNAFVPGSTVDPEALQAAAFAEGPLEDIAAPLDTAVIFSHRVFAPLVQNPSLLGFPSCLGFVHSVFGATVLEITPKPTVRALLWALCNDPYPLFFRETSIIDRLRPRHIVQVNALGGSLTKHQSLLISAYDKCLEAMTADGRTLLACEAARRMVPTGAVPHLSDFFRVVGPRCIGSEGLTRYFADPHVMAQEDHLASYIRRLWVASDEVSPLQRGVVVLVLRYFDWLSEAQRFAIARFILNRTGVLEGGPGTGKSEVMVLAGLVLAAMGHQVSFVAYIGKAALNLYTRAVERHKDPRVVAILKRVTGLVDTFYGSVVQPPRAKRARRSSDADLFGDDSDDEAAALEALRRAEVDAEAEAEGAPAAAEPEPPEEPVAEEPASAAIDLLDGVADADLLAALDGTAAPDAPSHAGLFPAGQYTAAVRVLSGLDDLLQRTLAEEGHTDEALVDAIERRRSEARFMRDVAGPEADAPPQVSPPPAAAADQVHIDRVILHHVFTPIPARGTTRLHAGPQLSRLVADFPNGGKLMCSTMHYLMFDKRGARFHSPIYILDESGTVTTPDLCDFVQVGESARGLFLVGDTDQTAPFGIGFPFYLLARVMKHRGPDHSRFYARLDTNYRAGSDVLAANQALLLKRTGNLDSYATGPGAPWQILKADSYTKYMRHVGEVYDRDHDTMFVAVSWKLVNQANLGLFARQYPEVYKQAVKKEGLDEVPPDGKPISNFYSYHTGMPVLFLSRIGDHPTGAVKKIHAVLAVTQGEIRMSADNPLPMFKGARILTLDDRDHFGGFSPETDGRKFLSRSIFHIAKWTRRPGSARPFLVVHTCRLVTRSSKATWRDTCLVFTDKTCLSLRGVPCFSLNPGWALTVKKSQGMEENTVGWLCGYGVDFAGANDSAYVAVTRAKKMLYLIGNVANMERAIKRRRGDPRRQYLDFLLDKAAETAPIGHVFDPVTVRYVPYTGVRDEGPASKDAPSPPPSDDDDDVGGPDFDIRAL